MAPAISRHTSRPRLRLGWRRRRAARRWAGELSRYGDPVPFRVHALYVSVVVAPLQVEPRPGRPVACTRACALPALTVVCIELFQVLAGTRQREDSRLGWDGGRARAKQQGG